MQNILGPIRQNGHVVKDIRAAVKFWTEVMGVGPFFLLDHITMPGFTSRGKPANPEISVAFSHHGNLQIELIEQHNDEPSMFREFLQSGREGIHHVAVWTNDYDRDKATMLARGFEVGHASEGHAPEDELVSARFCYVENKAIPGMIVEILERTPPGDHMQAAIEAAVRDWDGRDPLRSVDTLF
jgi:catechol 2,3-dioxygenase-like lactoylglutathione lyase family enzyme